MSTASWSQALAELRQAGTARAAGKAAKALAIHATADALPDLYAALDAGPALVREAAALPLARLDGAAAFAPLMQAMRRNEADGADNDGLANTVIGLLEAHAQVLAPQVLTGLTAADPAVRADMAWALGFLAAATGPGPLFRLLQSDLAPDVRAAAAESLQVFLPNPLPDTAQLLPGTASDAFDGTWMWRDTEPRLVYGVALAGSSGRCIQSNSPWFASGDTILRIGLASGTCFVGQQVFTNGAWYTVTARRDGARLELYGGGMAWTMVLE